MDDIDKKLIQDLGAGNMKCRFCGKIYCKMFAMDRHFANHAGQARYFCSVCDKEFVLHSYLHLHIRQHMIKEVLCEICGVQLGTQEILTCHVCLKEFKQRKYFLKHLKVHELEGLFGCGECLMQFKDKESFLAHVHGNECEKSTGGNEIGKIIVVKNPLQKNLMSVSGVVEPKTSSTKECDMYIYSQVDHPSVCVKTEEPEIFVKTEEPELLNDCESEVDPLAL